MKNNYFYPIMVILVSILISSCGIAPTQAPISTSTWTSVPTDLPTSSPTNIPTETPAPTTAAGATQVAETDGMTMVYVPAGDFNMGSMAGTDDEQPVHTVYLPSFWIDKTEVTNAMYDLCVQAGNCLLPFVVNSNTHYKYYYYTEYANYPVIGLRWESAQSYCTWAGRRLPTEAEWEKAAVGTDGRMYPWGQGLPNDSLLNYNHPLGDTVMVGSYLSGGSPYGALDMAGNVTEWVADWYAADYYRYSPDSNPTGPVSGEFKVLRGGSWISDVYEIRSADRHWIDPYTRDIVIGFRCAQTSP